MIAAEYGQNTKQWWADFQNEFNAAKGRGQVGNSPHGAVHHGLIQEGGVQLGINPDPANETRYNLQDLFGAGKLAMVIGPNSIPTYIADNYAKANTPKEEQINFAFAPIPTNGVVGLDGFTGGSQLLPGGGHGHAGGVQDVLRQGQHPQGGADQLRFRPHPHERRQRLRLRRRYGRPGCPCCST